MEIIICTYRKLLEDKPKTTRSICGNNKCTWRNYNIREAESYLIIWKLLDEKCKLLCMQLTIKVNFILIGPSPTSARHTN